MAPVDSRTQIGHVHLKVADIERSLDFYVGVLGFELQQRMGDQAAFISAGDYHHHIGLNTWQSRGGTPPPPGHTGLFHFAVLYPDRVTLADALRRLVDAGHPLTGASDHGVSEAIYLNDPDGNGVELYRDRPESEWPRTADGQRGDGQRAARPERAARGGSRCLGATWKGRPPTRPSAGWTSSSATVEKAPEERLAVFGSTAADPERHFLGWRDDVDPDELFASGEAWGLTVARRPVE